MIDGFHKVIIRTPIQEINRKDQFPGLDSLPDFFMEAIEFASPSLINSLNRKSELSEKEKRKLETTLKKYWNRSCTRSTPFGLFSSVGIVDVSKKNNTIIKQDFSKRWTYVRLDIEIIHHIIKLINNSEVLPFLRVYVNNSLYEFDENYRYVESKSISGNSKYELVSVEKSETLQSIIDFINSNEGCTFKDIVDLTVNITGESENLCFLFCKEIIDSKVITTEILPIISEGDPLNSLIKQIQPFECISFIRCQLEEIYKVLNSSKKTLAKKNIVRKKLLKLNIDVEESKNILFVDLFENYQKESFNEDIYNEILNQVNELFKLSRKAENPSLKEFKEKFTKKYENELISISQVIDPDLGLGYDSFNSLSIGETDFVKDFKNINIEINEYDRTVDNILRFSTEKYFEYLNSDFETINITDEDLKQFEQNHNFARFNESHYILGSLFNKETKLINESFTFHLKGIGGPSGNNIISRFNVGSSDIEKLSQEIIKKEEENLPEIIFADIIHLPEGGIGNIVLKKSLRNFEISYMGNSNLKDQLNINDLYVTVNNDEIVLWSKKYNKRVIPRLSNAHNFSFRSLPVYKFLCDLQKDNTWIPNFWDWGELIHFNYLPRVEYKNLILRRARWIIEKKTFLNFKLETNNRLNILQLFFSHYKLPQVVFLVQGDRELLLNSQDASTYDILDNMFRQHEALNIKECLFQNYASSIRNNQNNNVSNELIIPFNRKCENFRQTVTKEAFLTLNDHIRRFIPGQQWLYFKIYCGVKVAETVLFSLLPIVESELQKKNIEKFFFIRYFDDFHHLRFRLCINEENLQISIAKIQSKIERILSPMIEKKLVDKLTIDTYNREIERYGEIFIEEAESIFSWDSYYVIKFLQILSKVEFSDKYRFFLTIRSIDQLLADFNFDITEKHEIVSRQSENFLNEFGGTKELRLLMNNKYRNYQNEIKLFLDSNKDKDNGINEVITLLKNRSRSNRGIIEIIKNKCLKYGYNKELLIVSLLPSYIHMHVNRVFMSHQRRYELMLYYFLKKYYSSMIAISKSNKVIKSNDK